MKLVLSDEDLSDLLFECTLRWYQQYCNRVWLKPRLWRLSRLIKYFQQHEMPSMISLDVLFQGNVICKVLSLRESVPKPLKFSLFCFCLAWLGRHCKCENHSKTYQTCIAVAIEMKKLMDHVT
ncbi:LH2 [Bovine adenovirus 6]|uniref:LH2 n=1 Tax=Bovine adenovirus 6 TaxID=111167 RepID=K9MP22_9ADEN|nr:LH2 [Bovine adenovirus 6]AFV70631.1 LH2 [Bovine adenovirus 6]